MNIRAVGNFQALPRFKGAEAQQGKQTSGSQKTKSTQDEAMQEDREFEEFMASLNQLETSGLRDTLTIKQAKTAPEVHSADAEKLKIQKDSQAARERYYKKLEIGHRSSPLRNSFTPDELLASSPQPSRFASVFSSRKKDPAQK